MEIFEPFLDLNNLKFVGKSNGMHEFSSKQLFIIVSYFVYEMYHCAAVPGSILGTLKFDSMLLRFIDSLIVVRTHLELLVANLYYKIV